MRKTIFIFSIIASFCQLTAKAQTKGAVNGFHIGLGLEGALPSGGFNVTYNAGTGATLRMSEGIKENLDITLTSGALAFFPKSRFNAPTNKASIFIPVKAGARLMLSDHLYLMGELGVTFIKTYRITSVDQATPTYRYVNTNYFTYAPALGTKFGGLDLSLRYENLNNSGFVGLRIGYDF